jgi:hypothetical protein
VLLEPAMFWWLTRILLALRSVIEARASREAEILVLRHQLLVLNCKSVRLRLRNTSRPHVQVRNSDPVHLRFFSPTTSLAG